MAYKKKYDICISYYYYRDVTFQKYRCHTLKLGYIEGCLIKYFKIHKIILPRFSSILLSILVGNLVDDRVGERTVVDFIADSSSSSSYEIPLSFRAGCEISFILLSGLKFPMVSCKVLGGFLDTISGCFKVGSGVLLLLK